MNVFNLYINKLLENVGSVVFEEAESQEKSSIFITGVRSALGEKLQFDQVKASLSIHILHILVQKSWKLCF